MQKAIIVLAGIGGQLAVLRSQKGRLQWDLCPLQAEPVVKLIRTWHVHSPRVIMQLPAELTKMRLMSLPAVNPQETAKLIAMALAEAGEFQQKFLFDYQVIARNTQQLLAVLYTTAEQVAPYLKLAARCHLKIKRLTSLGDGLFAALQNGVVVVADGSEVAKNYGFFYEGIQGSLFFLVLDGQLIHCQYIAGQMNVEQLGQAFQQLNSTLQRRYQLAKIAVGYLFLPERGADEAERREKQLAFFAEVPIRGVSGAPFSIVGAEQVRTQPQSWSLLGLWKEETSHGL